MNSPLRVTTLLLALGCWLTAAPAFGALVAYEPFDYSPTGSDLQGRNGGSGFSGAWVGTEGFPTAYDIGSGSLAFASLPAVWHHVRSLSLGTVSGLRRGLTSAMGGAGTTRYISLLLRPEGVLHQGAFNGFFGIYLDGNTATDLFIGKPGGGGFNYILENVGGAGQFASTQAPVSGQTVLLVVKAEFAAGIDRFTLHVNPTAGGAEPAGGTVKNDIDVGTVTGITIFSTGEFALDEIRIGETYADVTPSSEGPPQILSHPQNQVQLAGSSATFSVGAIGSAPLSYRWFFNGSNEIAGATSSVLTLNNVMAAHSGSYHAEVSNALGSVISQSALLTIVDFGVALDTDGLVWTTGGQVPWNPLSVVTHDGVDAAQSGTIFDSQESWLQTIVSGPGTLTFWWRVSSEFDFDYFRFHIDGVLQQQISGEVNWQQRTYSIPPGNHTLRWRYVKDPNTASGQDRGWLDQVVFNPSIGSPTIASQPVSQVAWEGANVSIQAIARGLPPLVQQWVFNETNVIDGATNSTLVLSNVLPAQVGGYQLVVSNDLGSVTSSVARLTLTNNGPVTRVILFVDSPVASPFESALASLGLNHERVFSEFDLNTAVNGAIRSTTLVIVDAPQNTYTFTSFTSFINGGGRLLIGANSLLGNPALNGLLKIVWESRSTTPLPVYNWGGSPLFTGLGNALTFVEIGMDEDVQRLHAAAGAFGVAGFANSATPGAAAVVIGNNGRTIVNGFWIGAASSAASGVQFAKNEILFLTGPVSATAPVIRVQPEGRTILVGRDATLSVVAWGGEPLSYQWFVNETNAVPGATASTLALPSVQLTDAGSYSVVVSNHYGLVTSRPATLNVTTDRPVPMTLLFTDFLLTSPYETALASRGYPHQKFTSESAFNAAVGAADPDDTLVVVDGINQFYTFSTLPGFVSGGGRAILQYWNLTSGSGLAASFQVSVGQELTIPSPVYAWGSSVLLEGLSSPLTFADYFNRDGLRLQPLGGAQAVAGFVSAPAANQAALVIGNSGRTIVHGLWLEVIGSLDDAVRLARNELDFLIAPLPATVPFITGQPKNAYVVQGHTARLRADVGGSLPLRYQWRKSAVDLDGATNADFVLINAQADDSGSYDVVVSNAHGAVTSSPATLSVSPMGPIVSAVLFRDGPNASSYGAALSNLGIPFQEVANDAAFNSAMAQLNPALSLVVVDAYWELHYLSPLADYVKAGGRVILQDWTLTQGKSVAALFEVVVGTPFYTPRPIYEWGTSSLFNGLPSPMFFTELFNLAGRLMQPAGGAQAMAGYTASPSVNQAAIIVGNSGRTIVNGFVIEEISLFANSVRLAQNEIEFLESLSPRTPFILTQPQDQVASLGATATFSVTASGSQPLRYQWRHDDVDIPGATNGVYSFTGVQSNHFGGYSVVVSNALGVVTSTVARLELGIIPTFVQHPLSQSVVVGGNVTFSAEISGNPAPFGYEWRKVSTPIVSNTANARVTFFTLSDVRPEDAGSYRVVVRNAARPTGVASTTATLTVLPDTDGDGLPNDWESAHSLNPDVPNGTSDTDGDGLTDGEEYIAGTDPADPLSYLKIDRIEATGSAILEFETVSNRTYTVQYTDDSGAVIWSRLTDVIARRTNGTETITDSGTSTNRYYRLVTPRRP